ncbi:MAG: nucleoid-associated protein, partial [Bacteroidales bacterium]|nr:nucleoid-associated protein [Bacteroidales bacterium]
MITCDDAVIEKMVLHKVGNKVNNEPLKLSKSEFVLHGEISNILLKYFTGSFRSPLTYRLAGEDGVSGNKIGRLVKEIFADKGELYSKSVEIAKLLYDVSEHPNIKSGELYIVFLSRCFVEGETVDAIGIFKSENKETYLKVFPQGDGFDIESDSGINI